MISLQKPASRASEKKQRARDTYVERQRVYREVDQRDGYKCRSCECKVRPGAVSLTERGHHHHIVYRSKQGPDASWNLCLLCSSCHADVHSRRLAISGSADETLTFSRGGYVWRA